MTKVAINGFGRIGRLVLRAMLARGSDLEVVAINDLADINTNALLFKRDSVHGTYAGTVAVDGDHLVIDGRRIRVTAERDPAKLPHADLGVDLALECTGLFTDAEKARGHLAAGAKKVLISAPGKGVDLTVVYGVNHQKLEAGHTIVSNASCTTNCLAPIVKVMHEAIGVERGLMLTIHSYTNDQALLDQMHKDPRRARAAAVSMIPTTTGAARTVGEVIPELKGKLDGTSVRVPTPNVSLVDFTFTPSRDTTIEEVNAALKAASETADLKGILVYSDEPLVSRDYNGDPASSTVDSLETTVLDQPAGARRQLVRQRMGLLQPHGRHGDADGLARLMFRTLDDIGDVAGKRVLVRSDLNVPMEDGRVGDASRLQATVPTIAALADMGARVVVLSHFGRPKGVDAKLSLRPVAVALAEVLGRPVAFAGDCIGPEAADAVAALPDGGIVVLENTRFHAGEEANDPAFVQALAANGDLYVNDAFSAAHRAHASTEGLAHVLPAFAGRAMAAELAALDKALGNPAHPVAAVVGGAKVSSKLDVLTHLVGRVDHLIIGGGMANTFLAAKGISVGKSLCEHDLADTARDVLARAEAANCTVHLPYDVVVATEFRAHAPHRTVNVHEIGADEMILDIGGSAVEALGDVLKICRTLVWNGPLGAFELPPFDAATVALARIAAALTADGLVSVAGGGDTVAALNHAGAAAGFTFVSNAGGAFLEWMEGKVLPGVAALDAPAGSR